MFSLSTQLIVELPACNNKASNEYQIILGCYQHKYKCITWQMLFQITIGHVLVDQSQMVFFIAITNKAY